MTALYKAAEVLSTTAGLSTPKEYHNHFEKSGKIVTIQLYQQSTRTVYRYPDGSHLAFTMYHKTGHKQFLPIAPVT